VQRDGCSRHAAAAHCQACIVPQTMQHGEDRSTKSKNALEDLEAFVACVSRPSCDADAEGWRGGAEASWPAR
jgi:hypothetical protein